MTKKNTVKKPRDRMLKDKDFMSRLLFLTLPIALQSLMLAAVAAADALMLGAVEQDTMSAVSLASQIQFVQNMAMSASVAAFVVLGAQYWGKGDRTSLSRLFAIMMRVNLLISVAFFVGCFFFPRYLMLLFTDSEILIPIGIRYLRIAAPSYLMTGISQCYLALLKVTDKPRDAAVISGTTVVLNIVLNGVLIFGVGPLGAMNERGAATATLVARAVELVWAVSLSFRKSYFRPAFTDIFRRHRGLATDFCKCFFPLFGAAMLWSVGFTSYSAFVGHLGEDAAAANSVASVVRDLICCLCNGISAGGGILIGNELGAGHLDTGRLYGDRICRLGFICGFASTGIMLLLTPPIMAFVKLTDAARNDLWGMMLIMSFYMIGRAVNTVIINGIFASGGDTMFDLYSLSVTMWGLAVPLAALGTFVFNWPVLVVYACTCLDEVGKIPWVMIHYRKYKWVKDLTRDTLPEK